MTDHLTDEDRAALCDVFIGQPRKPVETILPDLCTAVESLIARHRRAAAVEALTEVADAWQMGAWADALSGTQRDGRIQERLATAQAVTDWLRERADEKSPQGIQNTLVDA